MVELEFDEFAGMDPEARAKATRKREAADMKKVEKWNDVEKKAQENRERGQLHKPRRSKRGRRRRLRRGMARPQRQSQLVVRVAMLRPPPGFLSPNTDCCTVLHLVLRR